MRPLGFLAALALAGCNQIGPQWNGWIYPNGADLTRDIPIGRFDTLEECRASARTFIANINLKDSDGEAVTSDYECGRSCKREAEPGGLNVCQETSK